MLPAQSQSTIMMVDDEPTTLDVIEAFLQGEGYERFVVVDDSRVAVSTARERRPDAVLLDLMMPHMNGLEVLTEMRRSPELQFTPVVILTSSTDSETKLKALELGATDFLAKPVDPSELALRLRNALMVKAYQDRLIYFDPLTGLPNRRRFVEHLRALVAREGTSPTHAAVFHIGLGRLQIVEDGLGRSASDEVVRIVAERLRTGLEVDARAGDASGPANRMLARAAPDEFLLLVEGSDDPDRASRMARALRERVEAPCRVASRDLHVDARVGVVLLPDDSKDPDTLLGFASGALSQARSGTDEEGFRFHDESANAESRQRLLIESHLRDALDREEVELHYQPKVDFATGRIQGAEALARWNSPELGPIPPDRFIPIAEESDLILQIGEWSLRKACAQARAWLDAGFPPLCIAVNVSARQFRTRGLVGTVESALRDHGLDGSHLVLELTESMIMDNLAETARTLEQLKRLGATISVDDFGTGYSSLSTLKRFPIDELKIDRSFVKGIPDDANDCAIVSAVIAMGHALGLRLVAEGVEQEPQADFLRERGCELFQGYLCSRPRSAAHWPELFAELS